MNIAKTYVTYVDMLVFSLEEALSRGNVLFKYLNMDNTMDATTFELDILMGLEHGNSTMERVLERLKRFKVMAQEQVDKHEAELSNRYFVFDDSSVISEVSEEEAAHLGMLGEDEVENADYDF